MKKKIKELQEQIRQHDHRYYVLDDPIISDFDYDQLYSELVKLEAKYPQFIDKNSPTQRVPGEALDAFEKALHRETMLSLSNSYSIEDLFQFHKRTSSGLNQNQVTYFCEPKIDGVAVELVYEKGILTYAITRGDGKEGENILENIKTIKTVPLSLPLKESVFEVRAEVVLFKKYFNELNKKQKDKKFANPRNVASGSLRNLNPKVTASRKLSLFCHSPGWIEKTISNSQSEFYKLMSKLNLPCFTHIPFSKWNPKWKKLSQPLCVVCKTPEEVSEYYYTLEKLRDKLPFEVDGVVVKVNSFKDQKTLGTIARSPRWATALKFSPDSVMTQIKDIQCFVGRTGVITPVAIMKPVPLGGVVVTQATLHNKGEIQRKDIRKGDFVYIQRAGDVIPEVIDVDLSKRKKNTTPFHPPKKCPTCSSKLQEADDLLYCLNLKCPGVLLRRLQHFCSRPCMNIEFLGDRMVEQFYNEKIIQSYSDIYKIKKEKIEKLEGMGSVSSQNIIQSINKSKKTSFARLLFSLGIRHTGEQIAIKLENHFGDSPKGFQKLLESKEEELVQIETIGPIVAQSIVSELKKLKPEIKKLFREGVKIISQKSSELLKEQTFVVTGSFDMKREEIESLIRKNGGRATKSVSGQVTYLLCGEKPGSKYDKAQKLKIPVIDWNQFQSLLRKS